MDWLDWIFETVAELFTDDATLTQAATAFEGGESGAFDMGGSEGFGGTTPLPDAEMPSADVPVMGAQPAPEAALPQAAPIQAPPPQAAPAASVAPPAPAAMPTAAPMTSAAVAPAGAPPGGIINSASGWFSKLSPAAQAVLASGVAGGAGAVMQSLAQKNASEDQERRDDKMREDRARRTAVSAFGEGAFKPKGIIDSRRT